MSKKNEMVLVDLTFPAMSDFINWLFNRLHAKYGADWTRQWDGMPIGDAKSDWGNELAWTFGKPDVIRFALQNLPERCPNSIQFRNICRAAPAPAVVAEVIPKADPARVKAAIASIAPPSDNPHGEKAWAYRLKQRHADGDRLSVFQISSYRTALGVA